MTKDEYDECLSISFCEYRFKSNNEEAAAKNELSEITAKINKITQDILLELELGGTKEDLDKLLTHTIENDVELGEKYDCLVITGSNTGVFQ